MSDRHGFVTPAELAILTTALDDYCVTHDLSGLDRDRAALRVISLFRQGIIDPTALADRLEGIVGRIAPASQDPSRLSVSRC